jgi:hypothetical protein
MTRCVIFFLPIGAIETFCSIVNTNLFYNIASQSTSSMVAPPLSTVLLACLTNQMAIKALAPINLFSSSKINPDNNAAAFWL